MNGLANDPARLHVQSRLGPVGDAKRAGVPIPQRPFALGHRARAAADNGMGDGLHGRHARPLRAVCAPVLTYTALAVLCIAVLEVAHVIGRLYRFRADRDRWMRHNGDLAGLPMGCRGAGQAAEHSRGGRWSRVRSPRRSAHFTRDQRRARGMPGASHEAGGLMALWCKAHHAWFAGIALLAAVTAELCFGGLLIGRAVPVGGPPDLAATARGARIGHRHGMDAGTPRAPHRMTT